MEMPDLIAGWDAFYFWVYNILGLKISRRKLEDTDLNSKRQALLSL